MSTEIKFRCPSCNRKLSVKPSAAGKRIHCPACDAKIQIPDQSNVVEKVVETGSESKMFDDLRALLQEKNGLQAKIKELES